MSKKISVVAIILSLVAIILAGISLCRSFAPAGSDAKDVQYVMFLGTNDKDTCYPLNTVL